MGPRNTYSLSGEIDSDQNGQVAPRPLHIWSDCHPEDHSNAAKKPFTSPLVSQICVDNDLKKDHVPQVTTKEVTADDMHSTRFGSVDLHDVSRDSISADKFIVSFHHNDPDNPYNWSRSKKLFIMAVTIVAVFNSTFGSALPSGAIVFMIPYFKITNEAQFELPISLFLVGYVLGPLFFAPLSETYGRKSILVSSFLLFTLFTLGCAVAPTWPLLLIFRFVAGVSASSPVAILGGLFADIYDDPTARGRANAFCMAATTMGPQLAPVVSGFVSTVSWRWSFWVALIVAGFSLSLLIFTPETYGPTILRHRARRLRKETGDLRIFAPIELEKKGTREMITVILMRPLRMLIFESIVLFTCLYLSLAYSIFYLFFVAYPLIFHGIYGMSTGVLGLAFLPIGLGAFIACGIFVCYDIVLRRAKKANAPWSSIEEYRRLPLACFGGSLYVVSLFWLGWTANSQIHWAVPLMAGLPFGIGFVLIFMALLNYLADAYEIFAASAMAASCLTRSVFGAVLPFAGLPMYRKLGIPWATSLLGFLSLAMTIVPFAFIKYGNRIRAGSKFCRELQERKQEMEEVRAQKESGADGNYKMSVTEKATEETQEIIPVV